MERFHAKLNVTLAAFPEKPWSEQFDDSQFDMASRFANSGTWPELAARWDPTGVHEGPLAPKRKPGRPKRRWDDFLNEFSDDVFQAKWWDIAPQAWSAKRQGFIDFVCLHI